MAFKRKLATFVSNWFGAIIATIVVVFSATFGGMSFIAHSRVFNATDFTNQRISLPQEDWLVYVDTIFDLNEDGEEIPQAYIYRLVLLTNHPYDSITIDVTISDVSVTIASFTLDVTPDDSWTKSVPSGLNRYTFFEGTFTMPYELFYYLSDKGDIELDIQGQITSSGKYRWVSRSIQTQFSIYPKAGFGFDTGGEDTIPEDAE